MTNRDRKSILFEAGVEASEVAMARFFAWFILVTSMLGAVIVWIAAGITAISLGIGIGVIFQGLVTWSLLRLVSSIGAKILLSDEL